MKRYLVRIFSFLLICLFGLPLLVLLVTEGPDPDKQQGKLMVKVLDKQAGKVQNLPIEEYLIGVVAAEMPAAFEMEALKAQAVVARTYTVKRMLAFGAIPNPQHPEAEVCTDPSHCQAWINSDEQKKKWGRVKYYVNIDRIKKAVKLTNRFVVTYKDAFIDPVYHGSCGGKGTENSEDVWTSQVPYLRSVDCASEYKAGQQETRVEVNKNKIIAALSDASAIPAVSQSYGEPIVALKKSSRGRVLEAAVFGKKVTGTELRTILGLGSTFMNWEVKGDKVYFTSTGKGHAVGMCQYGANGIALEEKSYKDIINHYYTDVKIIKLKY